MLLKAFPFDSRVRWQQEEEEAKLALTNHCMAIGDNRHILSASECVHSSRALVVFHHVVHQHKLASYTTIRPKEESRWWVPMTWAIHTGEPFNFTFQLGLLSSPSSPSFLGAHTREQNNKIKINASPWLWGCGTAMPRTMFDPLSKRGGYNSRGWAEVQKCALVFNPN